MTLRQVAHGLVSVLLAAGLLVTGNALAQSGPTSASTPSVVLYDQTDNVGSNFVDSSDWGSHYPTVLSQAGDDFVVPHNEIWKVATVTASGAIILADGAGVVSLLVQIYGNSASNLPAGLIYSQTVGSGSIGGLGTGVFVVTLNSVLTLGPGHYWLSVQARQNCTTPSCKHWVWTERTVQSQQESVWQNPVSSGYVPACPTWHPRVSFCHQPNDSVSKDLLFKLDGTSAPVVAQLNLPVIFH